MEGITKVERMVERGEIELYLVPRRDIYESWGFDAASTNTSDTETVTARDTGRRLCAHATSVKLVDVSEPRTARS